MELSNAKIVKAQQSLTELMNIELPIRVSLDIAKLSNMIDERAEAFAKVRDSLFKKYSIKTLPQEDGTVVFESEVKGETEEETNRLSQENLNTFLERLNELLEAKDELSFSKVRIPKETEGKTVQVKPEVLKALVDFLEVA